MQYLFDLVWLGFTFPILNIDARISRPGRLEDTMAALTGARFSKVMLTDSSQLSKANPGGVFAHLPENPYQVTHNK